MKDVALFAWAASLAIISLSEGISGYSAISEGYAFALRSFINAFFSSYIDVKTRIALKDRMKPTNIVQGSGHPEPKFVAAALRLVSHSSSDSPVGHLP